MAQVVLCLASTEAELKPQYKSGVGGNRTILE
jgi:hypothetical protein